MAFGLKKKESIWDAIGGAVGSVASGLLRTADRFIPGDQSSWYSRPQAPSRPTAQQQQTINVINRGTGMGPQAPATPAPYRPAFSASREALSTPVAAPKPAPKPIEIVSKGLETTADALVPGFRATRQLLNSPIPKPVLKFATGDETQVTPIEVIKQLPGAAWSMTPVLPQVIEDTRDAYSYNKSAADAARAVIPSAVYNTSQAGIGMVEGFARGIAGGVGNVMGVDNFKINPWIGSSDEDNAIDVQSWRQQAKERGTGQTVAQNIVDITGLPLAIYGGARAVGRKGGGKSTLADETAAAEAGIADTALTGNKPPKVVEIIERADDARKVADEAPNPNRVPTTSDKVRALFGDDAPTVPINRLTAYERTTPEGVLGYRNLIDDGTAKMDPIKVIPEKDGTLGIEDGKHRVQALRDAGIERVAVDADSAKAIAQADPTVLQRAADAAPAVDNPVPMDVRASGEQAPAAIPRGADLRETVYGDKMIYDEPGRPRRESVTELLDRPIRENVTEPAREWVQRRLFEMRSGNPVSRGISTVAQGFSKEAGVPRAILEQRQALAGRRELGRVYGLDVTELGASLLPEQRANVFARLDPEQAAKAGIKPTAMTPEEGAYLQQIQQISDYINERNTPFLTPEQVAAGEGGKYLTRRYSLFEEVSPEYARTQKATKAELLNPLKHRKDVVDPNLIESIIDDPSYLAGKRLAETEQARAVYDYAQWTVEQGMAIDGPRPNYVQLPKNKLYGEAGGKYVPKVIADDLVGFQYQSAIMNAWNDIISAYDRLPPRQARKFLLTVGNPVTRFGNQVGNRVMFSSMNGLNTLEFNRIYLQTDKMIKARDPLYFEAVEQGLFGTDITRADFSRRIIEAGDNPNIGTQAIEWLKETYSRADDRAKLTAYRMRREQGYAPQDAARLTQRGFQDYKAVGFFYDMAAKTPLIGNAFVRFASDATRIFSNTLLDHPTRAVALGVSWKLMTDLMSRVSGETAEDRATREDRFGAPRIPFTGISLTVQTPWGEWNPARFMPFYALNGIGGEGERFLPFQGNPTDPQNFDDPLIGPIAQLFADEDFRGKSIRDPENTVYYKNDGTTVKKFTDLDQDEQQKNIIRYLVTNYMPFGREADALISGARGEPDVYGKERNFIQALQRAAGIKVEEFGPEQAAKQRSTNQYFEGNVARVQAFLEANPDLASSYYKFNNPTRDRNTGEKASPLVTPERWRIIQSDRTGRLYEFLKSEALTANKEDGKPVDPIYQIPDPKLVQTVLDIRSRPTGDDIETEERLRATSSWYTNFEKAERAYYDANSKYFEGKGISSEQNPRVKAYSEIPYPEQSALVKQYYQIKEGNEQAGKDFFKANADALSADFDGYREKRLKYINAKRAIEGYPPITQDSFNNVTFGYEDDERKVYNELKYQKGYGGYGSGKGGGKKGISIGKYDGEIAVEKAPKTEVNISKPKKVEIKKRAGKKGGGVVKVTSTKLKN